MGRVKKLESPPDANLFFWDHKCPFCIMVWEALEINRLINKLEPKDQLIPVEVRKIGANRPTARRFLPHMEGTPSLVLGDVMVTGVTTVGYIRGFLKEWFKEYKLPWL